MTGVRDHGVHGGRGLVVERDYLEVVGLPYGRVVGVELDAGLAECARQNVARARCKQKAGAVDIDVANVLEWEVPENTSTVFMFNPFAQQTFRDVASAIFSSYDHNPRRLHIVYEHPWEHDWLVATGRVVVESVRSSTWPNRRHWWEGNDVIIAYHVIGPGDEGSTDNCLPHSRKESDAMKRWAVPNGHRCSLNR